MAALSVSVRGSGLRRVFYFPAHFRYLFVSIPALYQSYLEPNRLRQLLESLRPGAPEADQGKL